MSEHLPAAPPVPVISSATMVQPEPTLFFDPVVNAKHPITPYATGLSYKQQTALSSYQKGVFEGPAYQTNLAHYAAMETEGTFTNRNLPYFRASRVVSREVLHHNLPTLRDIHYHDRPELFSRKVRLCCYQFTPAELLSQNPQAQRDRDLKRQTCQELAQYIHTAKPSLTDDQLSELFEMFEINLFQPLPATWADCYDTNSPQDDDHFYVEDQRWDHIQLIYDILLKLANLTETDQRLLQKLFLPSLRPWVITTF
eukprot:UN02273